MPAVANSFDIKEQIIEIDNPQSFQWNNVLQSILTNGKFENQYLIKLNLAKTTKEKLYFNAVFVEGLKGFINKPFQCNHEMQPTDRNPQITCLIIPTGVGAAFGGYAGDANPLAKAFANKSKYLLTHPNVVNGAVLSDPPSNLIYLEGFFLDQFLLGQISIIPKNKNKIGVIFDSSISKERLDYEINVLNALNAFYGCEIIGWTLTEKPLKVIPEINKFGFSTGKLENLESLVIKGLALKKLGATALAVCCVIPDLELNSDYTLGSGIDPIGGIETLISRIVSASTGLVSAHAPVLVSDEKINYEKLSPLSASEYIAQTFLPSVISGLRFAPQIVLKPASNSLSVNNVSDILVPYNAFGSPGVFYMNEIFKNVTLIKENDTCLKVNPTHLNIDFKVVNKYLDLIDGKELEKLPINPNILNRPVNKISRI